MRQGVSQGRRSTRSTSLEMQTIAHFLLDWLRDQPKANYDRDLAFLYGKLRQVCKVDPLQSMNYLGEAYEGLTKSTYQWPVVQMVAFNLEVSPSWWQPVKKNEGRGSFLL